MSWPAVLGKTSLKFTLEGDGLEFNTLRKFVIVSALLGVACIILAGSCSDVYLADEAFHYRLAGYMYQLGERPLYDPLLHTNEFTGRNFYVNEPLWHMGLAGLWTLIGGVSQPAAQIYQGLLYLGVLVTTYLLAKELFGLESALYSALLSASLPFLITYSIILHVEPLLIIICNLGFLFILRKEFVLAGALVGLSFWTKRNAYLLAPALFFCVPYYADGRLRQRLMGLLAFMALFAIIVLPDFYYRHVHFGLIGKETARVPAGRLETATGGAAAPGTGNKQLDETPIVNDGSSIDKITPKPMVGMPQRQSRGLFSDMGFIRRCIQPTERADEQTCLKSSHGQTWVHPECVVNHPQIIVEYMGIPFLIGMFFAVRYFIGEKRYKTLERRHVLLYTVIPSYLLFFTIAFANNWGLRYMAPIIPLFVISSSFGFTLMKGRASSYLRHFLVGVCILQIFVVAFYVMHYRRISPALREAYAYAKAWIPPQSRTLCPKGSFALYADRPMIWNSYVAPIELDSIFWQATDSEIKETFKKFGIRFMFVDKDRIYDDTHVHHCLGYPLSFVKKLPERPAFKVIFNNEAASIWEIGY